MNLTNTAAFLVLVSVGFSYGLWCLLYYRFLRKKSKKNAFRKANFALRNAFTYLECVRLFYDKSVDIFEECSNIVGMSLQGNRFREVQAEDTHDGFRIDCISSGDQINVKLILV